MAVTRRDFLKKSGQATLAIGAGLTLDTILSSCATISFKETREEVINQRWETSPKVPIPKEGCYIGMHSGSWNAAIVKYYEEKISKAPAFFDFSTGKFVAGNDYFPSPVRQVCDDLINMGVVPEIKYGILPIKSFKEIAKGKHDDNIARFSEEIAYFGKPFMLVPFKEHNIKDDLYWPHGGGSPKWFREAWRHMHDVFESNGANANTIWALNYLGTCFWSARNLESFYPGDDVVDWIGFTVVNRVMVGQHPYTHFRYLFSADYKWARRSHPTKPLALFEMVQSENSLQHEWIRKAYGDLKEKFPAVKMAQWWEADFPIWGKIDRQYFSFNPDSVKAMREALRDPYFLGAPLPFLEKYRKG